MGAEPLVVEFEVAAPPALAFELWTRRCSIWWPASHTVSGDPSAIRFEPRQGGRIFEQSPSGEHDWGKVLEWEPPARLRYSWHLFFDPSEATEVEVTFTAAATGTAVRLEQSGWGRLAHGASDRRTRTSRAWGGLALTFAAACDAAARVGDAP